MENRTLIIVIGGLGLAILVAFVSITLFYPGDKGVVFAALTGLTVLFIPQLLSLKSSTENAVKIAAVNEKLDQNTDKTNATYKLVDGQMTEFKRLMKLYADSEAARVGAEQKAAGIVVGQNTPVVDQDASLAIDPSLKQDEKPRLGDHR